MAARYPRSLDSIVTLLQGDPIRRCPSDERPMKCTPFARSRGAYKSISKSKLAFRKKVRIFLPLLTAKATFALKAVAWRRRGRLLNHLSASAKLAALRPTFHFTDVQIAQAQS